MQYYKLRIFINFLMQLTQEQKKQRIDFKMLSSSILFQYLYHSINMIIKWLHNTVLKLGIAQIELEPLGEENTQSTGHRIAALIRVKSCRI